MVVYLLASKNSNSVPTMKQPAITAIKLGKYPNIPSDFIQLNHKKTNNQKRLSPYRKHRILKMKKVCFRLFLSLFVYASFTIGESCHALPFNKAPTSYQNWLNQKKWKGDNLKFMKIDECLYLDPDFILSLYKDRGVELTFNSSVYMDGYVCRSGFIEIRNPQGTKVCLIDKIETIKTYPTSLLRGDEPEVNLSYNSCRWKD